MLFTGGTDIVGKWYNDDAGDILDFDKDGTIEITTPYTDLEGEYEYDKGKGEGVITVNGEDYDFVVEKGELEIDGIGNYVRDGKGSDKEKQSGIIGEWYCDELEETLEFMSDGSVIATSDYSDFEGEYEYDKSKFEGVITQDGDDYDFTVDGDELDIEGYVYIRDSAGSSDNSFGSQSGIVGLWYDVTGLFGMLEVYPNGTVDMYVAGMTFSGTYEFDKNSGQGVVVFEEFGEGEASDLYLENGIIMIDRREYTHEYVEPMDLEEFMEVINDDDLNSLLNFMEDD